MNGIYRHGDVVIKQVDDIKGEQKKVNSLVLAEGEVTGHKHVLSGQILESVFDGRTFFELESPATLTHQEHDTLELPEGKYEYALQREVNLLGEVRQVMD